MAWLRALVSDPIQRVGLSLEAGDVFLLPARVSAHHVPLSPELDGLRCERDFACRFCHSVNMRSVPEDRHPRGRGADEASRCRAEVPAPYT
jgi:hypothetical protein